MPITKRQFQLGIDDEVEDLMRRIYNLLAATKDLAYSNDELLKEFQISLFRSEVDRFDRALGVLLGVGAIERREVAGTYYYAFRHECDTSSWKLKEPI